MTLDLVDRVAAVLRETAPPVEGESLRPAILEAFDRELRAPARRPALRWSVAAAFAAAVAASWLVVAARFESAPPIVRTPVALAPAVPAVDRAFQEALVKARIAALRETVASVGREPVERVVPPATVAPPARPVAAESLAIRKVAAAADEPVGALYRLASARRFESLDREGAAERYRELLQDYPDGSAAEVARARLRDLSR
ncbi:MAG TPA: hypothetical protein VKE69_13535 [Planctomycetota bacterium]|nr:hypothetical protein [Planctomycetota bacterium]